MAEIEVPQSELRPTAAVDLNDLAALKAAKKKAEAEAKKTKAKKAALKRLEERMGEVFQRRHDCIHNCDRPKVAMQGIDAPQTKKMIADIKAFVTILDDHITQHSTV